MKRYVLSILATALSVSQAFAQTYSGQTYLAPRTTHSYAIGSGVAHAAHGKKEANRFGGTVSVLGFYRKSHNDKDLKTYFGGGSAAASNANGTIEVAPVASATTQSTYGYFVDHASSDISKAMSGTINISPERISYGARISYSQALDSLSKGLFMQCDLPLERVETNMGLKVANGIKSQVGTKKGLEDYLAGADLGKTGVDAQEKLSYARIPADSSEQNIATGAADLRIALGYHLVTDKNFTVDVCAHGIVPTGNSVDGVNLFQSVYGNGGHYALGLGTHMMYNLWHGNHCKTHVDLSIDADYSYLFESSQMRTMGIYNNLKSESLAAASYHLLGKVGATTATPGANALTQKCDVTPGSVFDANATIGVRHHDFTFKGFYNLFARQEERIVLRNEWADGTFGLLDENTAVNTAIAVGGALKQGTINNDTSQTYALTTDPCTTKAQITHTVGGSVGYTFKKMRFPVSLSLGGSYEFDPQDSNTAITSWSCFGTVSACF